MTTEGIRKVAVIGGGLGGLSAARALRCLKLLDVHVCLYEKRCSPHLNFDRGIGIWPDAQKALKEIKVEIPEHEHVPPAHYRSKRGYILSQPSTFNNVRVWTMSEQALVENYMKTLEEDEKVTFFFGETVTKVHQTSEESVRIYSNWDSIRDFDLVIMADGYNSHYRVPLDDKIEHNVRCISGISTMEIEKPFETLGELNFRIAVVPLKQGCFWFVNIPFDAFPDMEEDLEAVISQLETRMYNWHKPIPDVLANTLRHTLQERATYPTDQEDIDSFHQDRVVLIGDAAHRIGINLAQGGSMAIEDGVTIAHCIGNYKELETAHYVYEQGRRTRHRNMRRVTKFTNWLATKKAGFLFSRAMWFVPHSINVSIFHRALNYSLGYLHG